MAPSICLSVSPARKPSFPRRPARLAALVLAASLAGLSPALAQDAKRGDDAPREDIEPFYGDAQQSIAIQVPGFRGLEPDISLRYRSSRQDDLLGVGWTLGGFSTIEAAAPRRGTPQHNSNDIFILDGQELVPCETGMVSPSCETGGTHATKIESYLRIKLDPTANTWEIWNREGTRITLEPVVGVVSTTPVEETLLDAQFAAGAEGFTYADSLFGSQGNSANYASGAWDNSLYVWLGGIDSSTVYDMSGGWTTSFTVASEMEVSLSFTYNMIAASGYESDEYSQVLMSFNGATPVVVASLTGDGNGGSAQTTGTQTHTENLGPLAPGVYTIAIGGYSNQKTISDESTQIVIDDVLVTGSADAPAYDFATTNRWAVSEVQDTHGNTVSYSWFNDDGDAYPETVSYNGSEINFFWEGRAAAYTTATGPNGLITTGLRLQTIDVQTGGQRVRAYALTYDTPLATTEEELLASVQMYGKDAVLDANGTVTAGTALPPTSFTYYDEPADFAASASWSTAHSGVAYKAESVQYADVNGDNLADRIFRTTNNQIHVSLSDGTQFMAPVQWAAPGGTYKVDQDSYADVNGDGLADMVFRKSNNEVGVYLSDGTGFVSPASWNSMGGGYYAGQVNVGDVNGDGKADLVFNKVVKNCSTYTRKQRNSYPACNSGDTVVQQSCVRVERGSDGGVVYDECTRTCRHCTYTEQLFLGLSNGTGFATPTFLYNLTGTSPNLTYHADRIKLPDVNGDGMVDLSYRADGNNVKIALSSGTDFTPLVSWYDFPGSYKAGQLQYADVNGDGASDALFHPITYDCSQYTRKKRDSYPACDPGDTVVQQSCVRVERGSDGGVVYDECTRTCKHCSLSGEAQILQVALSTGSDFLAPETWYTGIRAVEEPDLVKFADFDGDGMADLSYRSGSNAVTIALSTGTQFTTLTTVPAFNGGYKPDQIQLADVNGDGKDDVIHRATTQATSVALAGPAGVPTHALESVTNVYGGTLTYAYTPSSAWDNTNLPFVVNTVTSVAADDGRGGVSTTTYAYAGGLWDAPERRFLGFRTATATLPCIGDEVACPTVTTTFVQDFGAYSKPEKIERRDGAGTLMTMVEQEYSLNGATIPYTSLNTGTTRTIYEGGQSRRTKTTRVFDAYANVIESTFHGDFDQLGDELTSTTEFYPNTTNYIVSLPARLRQFEGEGTAGTMLTESVLYYDGATDLATPPSLGDVTTAKDWDDQSAGYVSSDTEYDAFGNVTATVDPLGRRSEMDYDSAYNLFPVAARNPLYFGGDTRQTTSATWDELCQLPLTQTDLNGQVTTHQYDELCRGVRTDTPAGNFSITRYPNLGDPLAQYLETETPPADGSGNIWTRSHLDGWGRAVQSRSKGPNAGQDILVDSAFDARGNVASASRPYYAGDLAYIENFSYDARNRNTEVEHADLATISRAYGTGLEFSLVTTTDEVGHMVTLHYDAHGRVVRKERALGAGAVIEIYEYDILGHLTGLTDDAGNSWTYTYDSLGRRLTVDDPDLGAWSYIYDPAGQLGSLTDAKGQTTSFAYDDLGRVTEKNVYNLSTAQTEVTTYTYDEVRSGHFNISQLTTAENSVGRIEYDHDKDGRLVRTTYAIDGSSYTFETGLDVAGRVQWQSYPDNDTVGSPVDPIAYDAAGRTVAIPGVTSSASYDARGAIVDVTRANGVSTTYGYSAERGWLEDLETLAGATTVQDLAYQRRADGEILGITSSFFGESWTYAYDGLKRLTAATNTDEPANSRSYAYDTVDNITFKSDVGSYSYPLPGSPRPHAVVSADGRSYSYDANGNMVQVTDGGGVVRDLVWDGEDRPIDMDGVTFHYGPDGARWKKVDTTSGEVTLTLGEIEIQDAGSVNETIVKYLPGSARRSNGQTLWHHKDHLNSVQAATDAAGAVALRRIHAPYGRRIHDTGASFVEAKDYIGERLDEETGLLYLNARYYDPVLGVFISGDPSHPLERGVGVNRYAYAGNNPIARMDPLGTSWLGDAIQGIDNALSDALGVDRVSRDNARAGGHKAGGGIDYYAGLTNYANQQKKAGRQQQAFVPALVIGGGALLGGGSTAAGTGTMVGVGAAGALAGTAYANNVCNGCILDEILNTWDRLVSEEKPEEGASTETPAVGPDPSETENTNPYKGPVTEPVVVVDERGNAIPVGEGESVTSSPDGEYQQVRDAEGRETGVRLDRGGHPKQADPRAREPHGHVPGIETPDGNPHLPIR